MSLRRIRVTGASFAAAFVLQGISVSHARCLPIATTFYVGDTTKDKSCNFRDVQAAIDAAVCPGTTIVVTSELTYTNQRLNIAGKSLSLVGGSQCGGIVALPVLQSTTASMVASQSSFAAETTTTAAVQATSSPPAQVALSGVGSGGDSPVIGISGNSRVTLRNLDIENGNVPLNEFGGYGGGVSFFGTGVLTLDNVTVEQNSAGYGGGIDVTAVGGAAELHLNDNVRDLGAYERQP